MSNTIRVNFHEKVEAALNKQINLELQASYAYQSMAFYFDRHDVALPGFSKYFSDNSEEEHEHAEKLMKYQNLRGGRIVLADIPRPEKDEWGSGLDALNFAFDLEKKVTEAIYELLAVATEHNDTHLADYLGEEFVDEQHEALKKLSDLISRCKRAGSGIGEHLFDKELRD
jgi:ferritin heavy chain